MTGADSIDKFKINSNKLFAKNNPEEYALFYIDVDKFKYINDMFGYDMGNDTLIHISNTIASELKEDEILQEFLLTILFFLLSIRQMMILKQG